MHGFIRSVFCLLVVCFFVPQAHALSPGSVGAMGIIEPKSRVLTLTHKGTMEPDTVQILFVKEGQTVASGDPIAQLGNHDAKKASLAEAEARIIRLKAQLRQNDVTQNFTKKEYQRRQKLQSQSAISLSERDEIEQNWQVAVAEGDALRAQLVEAMASRDVATEDLNNTVIRAPFAGTVLDILTRQGERASDRGIVTFADLSLMDVRAEVFESDVKRISIGQKAEIVLPQVPNTVKGHVYHIGFLVRGNDVNDTDPLADKDNRVVSVRIAIDPADAPMMRHQIYRRVSVRLLP